MAHRLGLTRSAVAHRGVWVCPSVGRTAVRRVMPVSHCWSNPTNHAVRSYASLPTQDQVAKTFATPFRQFIMLLSRMSRIVVVTAVGAGSLALLTFEGVHMYVEHSSMPKGQVGTGILDDSDVSEEQNDDRWGWTHDFGEEAWVGLNYKGTDPRLGFVGRHLLRAAWMSLNWGGGIDPNQYLSGGGIGAPTLAQVGSAGSGPVVARNGVAFGEQFLYSTLVAAEGKGIRLPDMAAIRAGVQLATSPHKPNQQVDRTAVMLEYQLANLRELQGSQAALKAALAGYVRLYDALSSLANTNSAMSAEGKKSGQPHVSADRLVRLATKIGELHALTGDKTDGEDWLLQAVQLAGGTATHLSPTSEDHTKAGKLHALKLADNAGLPSDVGGAFTSPAHSPSLTRSLIGALFSLSGFYASDANDRKALERALQFQANALRLVRVDLERTSLSEQKKGDIGAELHRIWLAHHDAVACVHVGETMYGLHLLKTGTGTISSILTAVGLTGGEKKDGRVQTLAWLDEAQARAKSVLLQLGDARGVRSGEQIPLAGRWQSCPVQIRVRAQRLLRDAVRLREAVDEMQTILKKMK